MLFMLLYCEIDVISVDNFNVLIWIRDKEQQEQKSYQTENGTQ